MSRVLDAKEENETLKERERERERSNKKGETMNGKV
jgi:hypothetical protein